jgi:tRNA dimethylallyltransferase
MIPVILGATAAGKSKVALELAKQINGEIISCDSRQIYKFMDIVTAKPSKDEQKTIKHHLIDILEPNEEYSAARWTQDSAAAIDEIKKKGKVPIICGGTLFYINAIRKGFDFSSKQNIKLRKKIEAIAEDKGLEKLYEILAKKNPKRAKEIHQNDKYRIVRALEIELGEKNELAKNEVEKEFVYFIISCSLREKLYERIDKRVDEMLKNGLYEEYKKICEKYPDPDTAGRNCVGYREFDAFEAGACSFEESVSLIKQHSRNYAKRQLTWLRNKEADKMTIDAEKENWNAENLARIIGKTYFN